MTHPGSEQHRPGEMFFQEWKGSQVQSATVAKFTAGSVILPFPERYRSLVLEADGLELPETVLLFNVTYTTMDGETRTIMMFPSDAYDLGQHILHFLLGQDEGTSDGPG